MKRLTDRARFLTVLSAFFIFSSAHAAKLAAQPEAVPGEYVVKLKAPMSFTKSNVSSLSQNLQSFIKSAIPSANIVVIKRPVFETKHSVLKTLAQNPNVAIVEPNYIYRINKAPNDPMFGQLWGMSNTGQDDSENHKGTVGVDIGAVQAWDIETGNKDAIIAVIDTGIDYNNPDLVDNVWTNEAELNGKPGVDDDNNGVIDDIHGYNAAANTGDPLDDHGHGSHCSGTIGAKGDDGKGIVGVAWNTRIMGVKFLDAGGSGTLENAIKAIDYATKMGAKVMSNSWGGGGESETLKEAIERANKAGAIFIAAAGNESNDNDSSPSYPASYPVANVLAVAAVDNQGEMASFSSYGRNSVHVGAPGVNILSTTTSGYQSWSGTSMATPHVSGIAALVLSHEPQLTNLQLKERIITTARPLTALRGKVRSGGIANAYAALKNEVAPPDMNDPVNWQTVPASVSTPHPYKERTSETYEVTVPDAKEISLYFEKFETEKSYDVAELYDSSGKLVAKVSGNNNQSFSPVIPGNYVKIVFKSDDSVNGYGFDVTKTAWR